MHVNFYLFENVKQYWVTVNTTLLQGNSCVNYGKKLSYDGLGTIQR